MARKTLASDAAEDQEEGQKPAKQGALSCCPQNRVQGRLTASIQWFS